MAPVIPKVLADLPELVSPEILASKLGIKKQTVYQRIWRQKLKPESSLLPEITFIPGCNRVAFARDLVIEWWISAQSQSPKEHHVEPKRRGRPTIAQQLARREHNLAKDDLAQAI